MEILRFDSEFDSFLPQPLTIDYQDADRKKRKYTPDGLIQFKKCGQGSSPILFEVKYRADFREQWRIILPKFRAAKAFCAERGWRFAVFTEREIRTPYLSNVKFLWPYRNRAAEAESSRLIQKKLRSLHSTNPHELLAELSTDATSRAHLIPTLWHLVAIGIIGCDLEVPLTMASDVWINAGENT